MYNSVRLLTPLVWMHQCIAGLKEAFVLFMKYVRYRDDILHVEEEELRSLWTADKIINVTKDESTLVAQRALHLANSEMKTNSQE
mgnify:CR=1 FL=1